MKKRVVKDFTVYTVTFTFFALLFCIGILIYCHLKKLHPLWYLISLIPFLVSIVLDFLIWGASVLKRNMVLLNDTGITVFENRNGPDSLNLDPANMVKCTYPWTDINEMVVKKYTFENDFLDFSTGIMGLCLKPFYATVEAHVKQVDAEEKLIEFSVSKRFAKKIQKMVSDNFNTDIKAAQAYRLQKKRSEKADPRKNGQDRS